MIIISVCVSSGFRKEIRDGISHLTGDIQLTSLDMDYIGEDDPISSNPSYLPVIESLPGVQSVEPTVCRAGIVKCGENIHGVLFK